MGSGWSSPSALNYYESREVRDGSGGLPATVGHPTPKPEDLMRWLITKCPPGVVADPFMGSGSTLRAAKDLGRKAIGIEVDERYCEVAARRMGQEVLAL
jgi:site-specific DNA-methyltransferase (adenine-specific)